MDYRAECIRRLFVRVLVAWSELAKLMLTKLMFSQSCKQS
jgi:hypothetical protein